MFFYLSFSTLNPNLKSVFTVCFSFCVIKFKSLFRHTVIFIHFFSYKQILWVCTHRKRQRVREHASKFGVFTQAPCVRQIDKTREAGGSFSSFSGVWAVIVVAPKLLIQMNVKGTDPFFTNSGHNYQFLFYGWKSILRYLGNVSQNIRGLRVPEPSQMGLIYIYI